MLSLERGEQINRAFPGLLLRLADYMDFDATRAPRILFRHAGIIDKVSIQEWTKHQAISGWSPEGSGSNFRFAFKSHQCPDPVTHKTILDFVAKIDAEIHAVREEVHWQSRPLPDAQRDHYRLDLPHKVEADVNPKGHPYHSIYIYHDLQFRLDQDEIQKLLMGKALYGDPGLCIRELLQNALDALELRKLRLKMLEETDETPREKVDCLRRGEELQVTLTWGRDPKTEQEFIRVTDNGVGMTRKVIQDYFTQVGKSYYRSADYRQEQAALANAGYTTSPISLFGIGILSCFMIAERMLVRTCPGDHDDGERQPFDVTISGPGSLFWLKPGTLKHQGTEITLYLKRGFQLQHNAQTLLNRLKKHFGYPTQTDEDPKTSSEIEEETGSKNQSKTIPIDPAFLAAAHVLWPRFPVIVKPPGEKEPEIRIDDRFHLDVLLPIDPAKVVAKAKEWDFPESCVGRPCWKYWEWRDDEDHNQATGSRVRLWFPAHRRDADPSGQGQVKDPTQDFPVDSPDGRLCCYHDLAAFVETQLEDDLRARVLVQGMHVQESDLATERVEIAPAVGTRLWVDLRGSAAPGLTTDRRRMLIPENDEIKGPAHWEEEIHRLFERCFDDLTSSLQHSDLSTWHNMATGFRRTGTDLPQPPATLSDWSVSLVVVGEPLSASNECIVNNLFYLNNRIVQDLALALAHARDLDLDRDLFFARARDLALFLARARALNRDLARARDFALALVPALNLNLDRGPNRDYDRDLNRGLDLDPARDLAHGADPDSAYNFMGMTLGSIFQEGFRPDLSRSWASLGLRGLRGQIGDAALAAPWRVIFKCESDGRTVRDAEPDGTRCRRLIELGYDLVFPMVAIPLGHLRRACPTWRANRRLQPLGVAPFLFPEFHDVWPKHVETLKSIFGVPKIYALCPRIELWDKPFDDWSDEDWKTCGPSVSGRSRPAVCSGLTGLIPIKKCPRSAAPPRSILSGVL